MTSADRFEFQWDGIVLVADEPDSHVERQFVRFGVADLLEATTRHTPTGEAAVIYDVGACVGTYALPVAKALPGARVYAFEPQRRMFERLQANIELNHLSNVFPLKFGLSSANRTAELSGVRRGDDGTVNYGAASLHGARPTPGGIQAEIVQLRRLDDVIGADGLPPPTFIKMDVEGHEYECLLGALSTIRSARPTILMEFNTTYFQGWSVDPVAPIHLLRSLGYRFRDAREPDRASSTNDIEYLWRKLLLQAISDVLCVPSTDAFDAYRADHRLFSRRFRWALWLQRAVAVVALRLPGWVKAPLRPLRNAMRGRWRV